MTDYINQYSKAGWAIKSVSLGNFGSWAVMSGDCNYLTGGLDAGAIQNLATVFSTKASINCFAQGMNGEWTLVFNGNGYGNSNNSNANLIATLKDFNSGGRMISSISILGSYWCIVGPEYYSATGPQPLIDMLGKMNKRGPIRCVSFAPNNGWLLVGSPTTPTQTTSRIASKPATNNSTGIIAVFLGTYVVDTIDKLANGGVLSTNGSIRISEDANGNIKGSGGFQAVCGGPNEEDSQRHHFYAVVTGARLAKDNLFGGSDCCVLTGTFSDTYQGSTTSYSTINLPQCMNDETLTESSGDDDFQVGLRRMR